MGTMGTWGGKAISSQLPSEAPHDKPLPREEGLVEDWGLVAEGEVVITWACTARWKAPRLKGSMEPL